MISGFTQVYKKILFRFIILAGLIAMPLLATSARTEGIRYKIYIKEEKRYMLDALTVYHPEKRQCDRTPLITASNSKIDLTKLQNQDIRWMALSRDLLKRWKGDFHYGDTVLVTSGDSQIDGFWVIKDTMNKRYKNRGDLLFDKQVRRLGKWENVELSKVTWLTI
jgi:hypothetical protein